MAKIALLIGVNAYGAGLAPLTSPTKDVAALKEVLEHPEIGGFEVRTLLSPDRNEMANAIFNLFAKRNRDDLLLLFFSGHGVKNSNGKLYLAARDTRISESGLLVEPNAVEASAVQQWIDHSRKARKVVILDCCFSGAFADGMKAKDDGSVPIAQQLGGEGWAVLTSSTSTQYSFEHPGFDLSIYTHFLVEGIKTGIADRDQDGAISVDELHEYAKEKVQDAAPEKMKPEIYPVKEGGKILLAKVPQADDPKLKYRQDVEQRIRDGKISLVARKFLNRRSIDLGLSAEIADEIELEVLKPYREYKANLQEYEQTLAEAIEHENPLTPGSLEDLQAFQEYLGLKEDDVAAIQARLLQQTLPFDPNSSESTEPNYTKLEDLLKAHKWREADQETQSIMIQVAGGGQLRRIKKLPCDVLQTIDCLWLEHSNGKFGFSVQARLWYELQRDYQAFINHVGWRGNQSRQRNYDKLIFNLDDAPQGHLPAFFKSWGGGAWWWPDHFYAIVEACNLLESAQTENTSEELNTPAKVLSSENGVDYTALENFLKAKDWENANLETTGVMLKAVKRTQEGNLRIADIKKFPCADLYIIDQLWLKYSNGRFGFSVQKQVWRRIDALNDRDKFNRFCLQLEWRDENSLCLDYDAMAFTLDAAPGHLPRPWSVTELIGGDPRISALVRRLEICAARSFKNNQESEY